MSDEHLPRVWLKAFWGFDPTNEGYLGFTRLGDREKFINEYADGDLVLIYGAVSVETAAKDRRQALGFLEVIPSRIRDIDRMSPSASERKRGKGWQHRWTYGVPVRRAWRVNRRIEVKHIAPLTYRRERVRVIVSRGEVLESQESLNALRLPVSEVSVYGEPPIVATAHKEFELRTIFQPSRGISPVFGKRELELVDGDHFLYLLLFLGDTAAVLGRNLSDVAGKVIVKVGFSNDPKRRCDEHNAAFPPASKFKWELKFRSKAFPDEATAKDAEDRLKENFARRFESLGGEFFLGNFAAMEAAFFEIAAVASFHIIATPR